MLGYEVNTTTIVVSENLFVPRETRFLFVPRGTIFEGYNKLVCEGFYNLIDPEHEHNLVYEKIEKVNDRYNNFFKPLEKKITIFKNFCFFSEKLVTYHELGHQFYATELKADIYAVNQLIRAGYYPEQIFWEFKKLRGYNVTRLREIYNYLANLWQKQENYL